MARDKAKQARSSRKFYLKHRDRIKIQSTNGRLIHKKRNKSFIAEYLKLHPCIDCGNNNIIVLDFDHLDASIKITEVSYMVNSGWSLENIIKEIAKCEVVCSNCHRIRTHNRRLKDGPVAE